MIVGESGCADAFSKYEALASALPASRQGLGNAPYRKHDGFWYPEHLMAPTLAMRDTFAARPTDVILATMPKSGTTWLKAIVYSVVHRGRHAPARERHPLLATSPHELVPFLHSLYENHRAVHGPARARRCRGPGAASSTCAGTPRTPSSRSATTSARSSPRGPR
jgi:hydroxyjasmonate sulfotransferase